MSKYSVVLKSDTKSSMVMISADEVIESETGALIFFKVAHLTEYPFTLKKRICYVLASGMWAGCELVEE